MVVAALVVIGLLVVATVQVRQDRDATADHRQRVEHALDAARVDAIAAGVRRQDAQATLDRTITRLANQRRARRDVQHLYDALGRELVKQRRRLALTSTDLTARSQQLLQLSQCLQGVAIAMRQASYDADDQAVATLRFVADVCARARGLAPGDAT
jgi:hypothetical protein